MDSSFAFDKMRKMFMYAAFYINVIPICFRAAQVCSAATYDYLPLFGKASFGFDMRSQYRFL